MTGEQVSVSPLTWSHSTFVATVCPTIWQERRECRVERREIAVGYEAIVSAKYYMRKAKILATLGPASSYPKRIETMIESGRKCRADQYVARNYEEHGERSALHARRPKNYAVRSSILVDLSGPKIRTRTLKDANPVELDAGAQFTITTRDIVGDKNEVVTNFDTCRRSLIRAHEFWSMTVRSSCSSNRRPRPMSSAASSSAACSRSERDQSAQHAAADSLDDGKGPRRSDLGNGAECRLHRSFVRPESRRLPEVKER